MIGTFEQHTHRGGKTSPGAGGAGGATSSEDGFLVVMTCLMLSFKCDDTNTSLKHKSSVPEVCVSARRLHPASFKRGRTMTDRKRKWENAGRDGREPRTRISRGGWRDSERRDEGREEEERQE